MRSRRESFGPSNRTGTILWCYEVSAISRNPGLGDEFVPFKPIQLESVLRML